MPVGKQSKTVLIMRTKIGRNSRMTKMGSCTAPCELEFGNDS